MFEYIPENVKQEYIHPSHPGKLSVDGCFTKEDFIWLAENVDLINENWELFNSKVNYPL